MMAIEACSVDPMMVATTETAHARRELPQVPEAKCSILTSGEHLVRHIWIVIHISSTEKMGSVLSKSQSTCTQVPSFQMAIIDSADLLSVVGVYASAHAPLPYVHVSRPSQAAPTP
eukprot:CAMPEP_0197678568 /NCGR_PEP_ID=MMETSP1338-20131121/90264_1 /TAXON_ID=43686 ORGANISM="Pelagodinium beii, Strain RCC1491" /NCGR_SAMPLE_ID=MMETSP1338 /ASSEMBLY_ACC=CAM_ASM_000754 /LENGTH=115 /DNA_ID=CAMNT_0043259521 /DNA_START=224 /DNA_END=571 /DNA_ORIENTATION=+